MSNHEELCNSNPKNFRACSMCQYIQEEEITYDVDMWDGISQRKSNCFRCTKLEKLLYPFKVEKMDLLNKYPETFDGQEPMPKECKYYKNRII